MKRIIAAGLIATMVMGLCACGGNKPAVEGTKDTAASAGQEAKGDSGPSVPDGADAEYTELAMRLGTSSAETTLTAKTFAEWGERIKEKSGGRIKLDIYCSSVLGNNTEMVQGAQMGTIDIAVVNQSTLGNFIPDFPALDIPYLIISTDQADQVFLGEIGNYFLDELSGVQLYGLGIWESGFRNLTNSKADVNSVDDITGLKIRTMENQIHIAFWKALGADATPMAWGEAYTALQQGALDGQENPSTLILTNNVAQVNKHMAVTEHAYSTVFLVMSPATWASLDEEMKQVFQDTVMECGFEERKLSRKMDAEAVEQLKEQGMVVTYPDKQQFTEAAASLYGEWEKQYGDIMSQIRALQNKQ